MRSVTYAGETVTTTDDVADALVVLTAAVAREGGAEAISIPIVQADGKSVGTADLVIGVGNDVLSATTAWDGEEPDFSAAALEIRAHRLYPPAPPVVTDDDFDPVAEVDRHWDPDLNGAQEA